MPDNNCKVEQPNARCSRGVHAIQILAFLSTAYATTGDELFKTAYETLTNATNQYHENLVRAPAPHTCNDFVWKLHLSCSQH